MFVLFRILDGIYKTHIEKEIYKKRYKKLELDFMWITIDDNIFKEKFDKYIPEIDVFTEEIMWFPRT